MYKKLDYNDQRARSFRENFLLLLFLGLLILGLVYILWYFNFEIDEDEAIIITRYEKEKPYSVVCYYSLSSNDNDGIWNLRPAKIDPQICTHVIVGFAGIVNNSINLGWDRSMYKDIVALKRSNPKLKLMISVGGAGQEMSNQFRSMTENHAKRKVFIKSVLNALKLLNFDGLDIDWEYPSWLHLDSPLNGNLIEFEKKLFFDKNNQRLVLGDEREKIHFVQLLQELRKAFYRSGRQLLLSVAVGAPKAIVDQSYNVPQIAEHIDFINLMSYDYHFYISYFPVTDLNSPLFSNKYAKGYLENLNVNYSANYWVEQGMPREKIVVGIPTYGHSYQLYNAFNHDLHSPARGFGEIGSAGFVNYTSVCQMLKSGGERYFILDSRVPYAYKEKEWISYDDIMSVIFKALWIKESNFRGAMVYSLNSDDWTGFCLKNQTFPLVRSINYVLNGQSHHETPNFSNKENKFY